MGSTLFGNPASQQQPTVGSGLFGSTTTSQQPSATGGGLFGGMTQQPSATGGSLFGGTTPSQQPSTAGSSLFGGTTQPAAIGGSIFGSAIGTTSGASTISPPTLFGQPPAQTSTSTTQPTTWLFGQSAQSQQPQKPTGSLFGSATQPSTTGTLFGSTPAAPTSGAGLGTGSVPGTTTGTTMAPTLFGQLPAQTLTSATQPTTSLFGQSTQSQQPQKPTGSLFGSTTQPSTTGTLFGSTLSAPTLGTGLGTGSILGTSTSRSSQSMLGATSQQQDPQSQFVALIQRIDAIAEAWNPNSPQCRFHHYFYNLVDPALISQYGRPANATSEALWQRAIRESPDPSCMVPVLAVGFDALNARVEAQSTQATAQQEKLKELKKRLQTLTATHTDTTLSRLHRALSQHTQLSQRLLKLVQHLHLLIPAVRSSSIRPEEEALRVALEEMEEDLRRPSGTSKIKSKLNELWALVGAVNAARERGKKAGSEGAVEWTVVDEEGLKQITQILSDQQAGLQHLTKTLQRDLKDLGVIMGTSGEREDGHANADMRLSASPSLLNSSTSTLHASALR